MKTTELVVTCDNPQSNKTVCGYPNKRVVKIYHPDEFSPKGPKSVLSQYWCEKCGSVQMIRYEFYEENGEVKARLKHRLEPDKLSMAKKDPVGITVRPRSSRK